MEAIDSFFTKWNGNRADFDGAYGAQCVDLVNFYNRDVVGGAFIPTGATGGARDWYEQFAGGAPASYERIANTPDPNQLPQKGDVIVWGNALGFYGHIAIVRDASASGFTSFDQNYPGGSACHFQWHNWTGVLGWLRPKKFITTPQGGDDMIDQSTLTRLFQLILLRDPDAGAVQHYVGRYATSFVIADLLASSERARVVANMDVSRQSTAAQLTQLSTELGAVKQDSANKQAALDALQLQLLGVSEALKISNDKLAVEQARVCIQQPVPVDEQKVVENWLTRLWKSLFNK
jgi:hypothetical protein